MRRLLTLIATLVAVGCQLLASRPSVLDDKICSPPCWHNIVPGKSTKQDVLLILSGLSYIDRESIVIYDPKQARSEGTPERVFDEIIYAPFTSEGPSQATLGIYILGGKVSVISFQLYGKDITLSEAIENMGEPQHIVITPYAHNLAMGFVSPSKGIAFAYSTVGRTKRQVSEIYPNVELSSIYFFDTETFEQFLDARLLSLGERDGKDTFEHLMPWTGYGNIEKKYQSQR